MLGQEAAGLLCGKKMLHVSKPNALAKEQQKGGGETDSGWKRKVWARESAGERERNAVGGEGNRMAGQKSWERDRKARGRETG
ncbi:hypothetical protein XELAEV_18020102mg [Xenopus laevis]|uniref:Uncharacterized protein n=1 Tax=Xenopus laevis TaxID=8355 RepID=A0A974HQB9_XENLA|nr:hypothetical protein XELAEV_18020102mg [Xenopus laevis]